MKLYSNAKNLRSMVRFHNRHGAGCIRYNTKTGISVETRSCCPRAGTAEECPYCYARESRELRKHGYTKYNHDLLASRRLFEDLRKLNADLLPDFIRFYGWSDHWPEDKEIVEETLDLCNEFNWKTLAVTRQIRSMSLELVRKFTAVHVSIDTSTPLSELKQLYRIRNAEPNALIRAVILTEKDLKMFQGCSDILTFYHGPDKPEQNLFNWSKKRIKEAQRKYALKEVLCGAYKGGCRGCEFDCIDGAIESQKPVLKPPPALIQSRWAARRNLHTASKRGEKRRRQE